MRPCCNINIVLHFPSEDSHNSCRARYPTCGVRNPHELGDGQNLVNHTGIQDVRWEAVIQRREEIQVQCQNSNTITVTMQLQIQSVKARVGRPTGLKCNLNCLLNSSKKKIQLLNDNLTNYLWLLPWLTYRHLYTSIFLKEHTYISINREICYKE